MKKLVLLAFSALLTAAPAVAQTWQIDPAHSRAQFTVRHFGISNVRGDFYNLSGSAEYDGKDVTKAKIRATIDVNTITTHVAQRDTHLKSADFLEVAKYPTMTFESTSITAAGPGKYKMTGNLTMHGVTKPVTFDLEAPSAVIQDPQAPGTRRVGAAASATINRKDFSVNYDGKLPNGTASVSDEVKIQLDVELLQAPAGAAPAAPGRGRSTN
jgi:polyisoprenoid-binding protein YceI